VTTHGDHPALLSEHRKQRRPGPANPNYAIPHDQWPNVLRRVDQGESYRQIAQAYHTSYQSIYRIVRTARCPQGGEA
jgi:DNA invertase Pin-like site-specific DNA recombinase